MRHHSIIQRGVLGDGAFDILRQQESRRDLPPGCALDLGDEIHGRPVVIIARTTKGKGVSFMENAPEWHGGIPNDQQFRTALQELQEGADLWPA